MEMNKDGERERSHNPDQEATLQPTHETGKPLGDKSQHETEESVDGKGRDAAGYVNDVQGKKEKGDDEWQVEGEGSERNK